MMQLHAVTFRYLLLFIIGLREHKIQNIEAEIYRTIKILQKFPTEQF